MENDALTQVQQRLSELPADVRAAIQSSDLDEKVRTIGAKHQLHIDQIGELGDETMLAMLGFSPLETFGKRLSTALTLTPEAGEKLAGDISNEIFGSIRESMKKFATAKAAPAAAPTPAAAPAAAAPVAVPAVAAVPAPVAAPAPAQPPQSPQMQQANVVLSEKTVSMAPPAPKPAEKPIYKADPYREPV